MSHFGYFSCKRLIFQTKKKGLCNARFFERETCGFSSFFPLEVLAQKVKESQASEEEKEERERDGRERERETEERERERDGRETEESAREQAALRRFHS